MMPSKTQLDNSLESRFQEKPRRRLAEEPTRGERAGRKLNPELCTIRLSRIRPDENQVRQSEDKGPDSLRTKELAKSIADQGVLQPITVRYMAEGDYFQIVGGERRYHASILAGKEDIPCSVKNYDDREAARAQLAENIHRQNLTPIEIGLSLQARIEDGETIRDLVQFTNKTKSWVSRHLSIANKLTTEAVDAAIRSDKPVVALGVLYEVSKLPADQQVATINQVRDEGLTRDKIKPSVSASPGSSGRNKKARPYSKSVNVDGATVTIKFRKSRVSSAEVLEKLAAAVSKLQASQRKAA